MRWKNGRMGKNIERLGRRNEKNGIRLRDGKEKR
jgi:hypothetical protein